MKLNHPIVFLIFLIPVLVLSGCAGGVTAASSWPGLTVDELTAYLAYNNHVYAIQIESGTQLWRYPQERDARTTFYADPVLSPDGQLILGGYNNVLYSLNPESGTVNWEFNSAENRYVAPPLVNEQGIFAPAADEKLYALTLSGESRWEFSTQGEAWAQPTAGNECECLYLPTLDHRIYAVDLDNGDELWRSEDFGGAIVGKPALSEDGALYVGSFASEILALDTQGGSVLWRAPTEDWVWSGPTLAGDRLYVGDLEGYFYALNATSGEEIWKLAPGQLDGKIVGSPLVIENDIYVVTESGNLYNLDDSGKIKWTKTVGGKLYTTPRLAGDLILVAPIQIDAVLVAYTREGAKEWEFIPPEE